MRTKVKLVNAIKKVFLQGNNNYFSNLEKHFKICHIFGTMNLSFPIFQKYGGILKPCGPIFGHFRPPLPPCGLTWTIWKPPFSLLVYVVYEWPLTRSLDYLMTIFSANKIRTFFIGACNSRFFLNVLKWYDLFQASIWIMN